MSQITPSVITLPGIDQVGASLVQNETQRLQSDTNSKRAASVEMRGQDIQREQMQSQEAIAQQQIEIQKAQENRLRERDLLEERMTKSQLELQARLSAANAKRAMAYRAADEEGSRAAQDEADQTTLELKEIQEKQVKVGFLNLLLGQGAKDGLAESLEAFEAGRLKHDNAIIDAIKDGMVDFDTSDEATRIEPDVPFVNKGATSLEEDYDLEMKKGRFSPTQAVSSGFAYRHGSNPQELTGNREKDLAILRGKKAMGGSDRSGILDKVLAKIVPVIGFKDGNAMQEGKEQVVGLFRSLMANSGQDPALAGPALDEAKERVRILRDEYGLSERAIGTMLSAVAAVARGSKTDTVRTRQGHLQGQLDAGKIPVDQAGEDYSKVKGQFEDLERAATLGLSGLGINDHAKVRFTGDGTMVMDPQDSSVRKTADGQHYVFDGAPSMVKALTDVLSDIQDDGELTDLKLLDNLPKDMVRVVQKFATEFNQKVLMEEKQRGFAFEKGERRNYTGLTDYLSKRYGELWKAGNEKVRTVGTQTSGRRSEADSAFLSEQGDAYRQAQDAFLRR